MMYIMLNNFPQAFSLEISPFLNLAFRFSIKFNTFNKRESLNELRLLLCVVCFEVHFIIRC